MKNGIPFDVAFSLDEIQRTGWGIILFEQDGGKFDWNKMEYTHE